MSYRSIEKAWKPERSLRNLINSLKSRIGQPSGESLGVPATGCSFKSGFSMWRCQSSMIGSSDWLNILQVTKTSFVASGQELLNCPIISLVGVWNELERLKMRHTWKRISQPDTLDLTECNLVLCPIVEFGCPRRLMACHLLGVLEPAVVLQVNRDACCPPGVTSDRGEKTRCLGPLPNSSPGVVPI